MLLTDIDMRALAGNERWFLVHTLPHSERKAGLHLGAQGFRTHLPLIQKTIRHARQLRNVRAPLFPRYIFVILDLGRDRFLSVRSTIGVSSLFSCDGRPIPAPEGVVEASCQRSRGSLHMQAEAAVPDLDGGLVGDLRGGGRAR